MKPKKRLDGPETFTEERIVALLHYHEVPEQFHLGLVNYLAHRLNPGSFLRAVFENDLRRAVSYADPGAFKAMPAIVRFLVNDVPAKAWGSEGLVNAWLLGMRS